MSSSAPLDIQVIYSASGRSRRASGYAHTGGQSRSVSWVILGMMNIAVGVGLAYVAWQIVDPFLKITLLLKGSVAGVNPAAIAGAFFGIQPADPSTVTSAAEQTATAPKIIAAMYTWLTLATLAAGALTFAGGATIGAKCRRTLRLVALGGIVIAAALMTWKALGLWQEFEKGFPSAEIRAGWIAIVMLVGLAGFVFGRRRRGLTRLAAIVLLISATASGVGLYLGQQWDALDPEQATLSYLAIVFVIHSFWGWVLLPLASRLGRA